MVLAAERVAVRVFAKSAVFCAFFPVLFCCVCTAGPTPSHFLLPKLMAVQMGGDVGGIGLSPFPHNCPLGRDPASESLTAEGRGGPARPPPAPCRSQGHGPRTEGGPALLSFI